MFACTGQNTGYCLNVDTASDSEILNFIAARVTDYVRTLNFTQDSQGAFSGSPYDVFLVKNNLPRLPNAGELDADYTLRLAKAVNALTNPQYVTSSDGQFTQSPQPFKFGSQELRGLKIFLKSPKGSLASAQEITQGRIGNCLACHPAPKFSDFNFHTTGVSQAEYDGIHGVGTFQQLVVPDLKTRNQNYNRYLPATSSHPNAQGPFRRPATASNLTYTDLGLWNIFANPGFPLIPSSSIALSLGLTGQTNTQILPQTIARFKTPGLRGLTASDPYFHNGSMLTLEDTLAFYQAFSSQARAQQVRNADAQLSRIALQDRDIAPLAAFLRGLTADLPSTP